MVPLAFHLQGHQSRVFWEELNDSPNGKANYLVQFISLDPVRYNNRELASRRFCGINCATELHFKFSNVYLWCERPVKSRSQAVKSGFCIAFLVPLPLPNHTKFRKSSKTVALGIASSANLVILVDQSVEKWKIGFPILVT